MVQPPFSPQAAGIGPQDWHGLVVASNSEMGDHPPPCWGAGKAGLLAGRPAVPVKVCQKPETREKADGC